MGKRFKSRSRKIARESYWERYDRDDYKCPDCGRAEDELRDAFEVHHKNGEPMDNRPENQIALCRPCHNLREGKKPSIEDIKSLRDQIRSSERDEKTSDYVPPLSSLSKYNGEYGAIICPGCGDKLGVAQSDANIYWTHHCCGVDNREIPTTVVVDSEKRSSLPKAKNSEEQIHPSILKKWVIERWVEVVSDKASVSYERQEHVGWEDGEPTIIGHPDEMDISGHALIEVQSVADTWGWEKVANVADEAADCPEPAKGFRRTLDAYGLRDNTLDFTNPDKNQISLAELNQR